MKKEIIISLVIIALVAIGFAGSKWLVNSGVKSVPNDNTTTEYRDEKFAYRFVHPNSWTTERVALTPGFVQIKPPYGKQYSLYFWYKDSEAIKDMAALETFVKDDAAYAEKEQGYKIVKIFPERLGNLDGFAYDSVDKDGKIGRSYYVADFSPTADQNIFVWTVGLLSETNSLEAALVDKDVQDILGSYKLLE